MQSSDIMHTRKLKSTNNFSYFIKKYPRCTLMSTKIKYKH